MAIQIQIRRDTAANWTSVDPILAEGEFGLETDTNQMKIGDGVLAWTALAYFGGGGNPFDQDLNTTDAVIFDKVTLTGPIIERQVAASFSSGVMTLDCNSANVFTHALTSNVTTVTINNIPTSGSAIGLTLILEADGTQRTITWPASFLWSGNSPPTITATNASKDAIVFFTYDAGTSWLAFVAGQDLYAVVVASGQAIFGYGYDMFSFSLTNLVSNTGIVSGDVTGVGTARYGLAASSYGSDKAIFGYGYSSYSMTNLVSNSGVVSTDTTGVGTGRAYLAAAPYGADKAIFGYGFDGSVLSITNLVSNSGVVSTNVTGVGTARYALAASGYGTDKAIFGYGNTGSISSLSNLVSNTGVVANDVTGVGTPRYYLAASSYGSDKAIFGYGYSGSISSLTNLVSNTGVVATDTTGVGTARYYLASSSYGSDKGIFGYGYSGGAVSMTNLVSNTGVVATDTTGVGTGRYYLAAASYG